MTQEGWLLAAAIVSILFLGPVLLGLVGSVNPRRVSTAVSSEADVSWDRRLTVLSVVLYTLAFNLTFFIQELFLVLPKAFTPGLRVTLFHNNHTWEGEHALVKLFQSTGAAATVLAALICAWLLGRGAVSSIAARLFLIWMVYCGFFMALPQVVVGALSGGSDVGMAMDYFGLSTLAKTVAALIALALVPLLAQWLTRRVLELAASPAQIATRAARSRFVLQTATLPAFVAVVPILAFRVPREWIEVVLAPLAVTWIGSVWMQAGAWRIETAQARGRTGVAALMQPLIATVLLLLIFQCVLRPGIRFY
jgi:hypothetical protein